MLMQQILRRNAELVKDQSKLKNLFDVFTIKKAKKSSQQQTRGRISIVSSSKKDSMTFLPVAEELDESDDGQRMKQLLNYGMEIQAMVYILDSRDEFKAIDPGLLGFTELWIREHRLL